jgi:hypothetical protein
MSAMTNYLENKLVDHIFRNTAFAMPSIVAVGLMTAVSDPEVPTLSEVSTSGTGYGRVQVGPSVSTWKSTNGTTSGVSSGTNGTTSNAAPVQFAAPTGNWGVVTHFGVFDALTGGNCLFIGTLSQPKTVNSGDAAPQFQADALGVTLA